MIPIRPVTANRVVTRDTGKTDGDNIPHFDVLPPLALYIHIPWCIRKCPYCDFYSHEKHSILPENDYLDVLRRDLELSLPMIWGRKVSSIFIGGGTPSLLSAAGVDKLLSFVRECLPVLPDAEISMEANPGTFETGRFKSYRESGINRLSIGIQSFNQELLHKLGRIHDADEARNAVEIAQRYFDNVNLDLMYGLPEQTQMQLQDGDVLVLRYTLAYGRDVGSGDIGNAFCVSMLNGSLNVSHQWSQDGTEPAVCASCGKIRACEHPQTEYRETEDGTMCYEFCLKCQKAITDPELHDWQITPIEQNDEQHSKTCRRCEKQIEEEHRFEFIEDTATCKQEGETVSRCMDCGYEKREPSEKLSHRPAIHVSEQEHWEECEVCGEEIEGSRAEHRYEWDDGLQDWACTCGYTHKEVCKGTLEAILDLCTCSHETTRCSGCGKTFERDAPGAFDYPHSYEIVVDECTCSLEVKQCVYCGDKTEQPGTYENYPHSYVDGFCRFCGAPEPVTPGPDPDPDPNPEPGPEPDPGTEEGPEE